MTDSHISSKRPKMPIQERGERRVADLLRAAEQLFATLGYEATTMSGIADSARASIGSLYQFFPCKESIASALLMSYMDELSGKLDSWRTTLPSTPQALGHDLITLVIDYVAQRPACRVLAETPSLVPESYGMEAISTSVRTLLATFAPSLSRARLSVMALTAALLVRATVQGVRMVDAGSAASLRREMQGVLGSYFEEGLSPRAQTAEVATKKKRSKKALALESVTQP